MANKEKMRDFLDATGISRTWRNRARNMCENICVLKTEEEVSNLENFFTQAMESEAIRTLETLFVTDKEIEEMINVSRSPAYKRLSDILPALLSRTKEHENSIGFQKMLLDFLEELEETKKPGHQPAAHAR